MGVLVIVVVRMVVLMFVGMVVVVMAVTVVMMVMAASWSMDMTLGRIFFFQNGGGFPGHVLVGFWVELVHTG
jgi:hypothetical protein